PSPNIDSAFQAGRNEMIYRVDKTVPTALIEVPSTADVSDISIISGTAGDANSGVLRAEVAYYGESEQKWWDPNTKIFNLGALDSVPLDAYFIAAATQTVIPAPWQVTGSSVPTMVEGQFYRIFARSTDRTGIQNVFPGHGSVTTAPSQSSFMRMRKVATAPSTLFTTPVSGTPHFKSASLTLFSGTLTDATTVQVRVVNQTPSPDEVWTGAAWVSTATYLLGCTNTSFVVDQSTCGFIGTENLSWTKSVAGIWPAGTNQFAAEVRGVNGTLVQSAAFDTRGFFIDDQTPSVNLTHPLAPAYRGGQVVYTTATAQDVGIGQLSLPTAKFELIKSSDGKHYNGTNFGSATNYMLSAQVAAAGPPTVFNYTDANLRADTVFQDGLKYQTIFRASDRAGNENITAAFEFIYDKTLPTSDIASPVSGSVLHALSISSGAHLDPDPDLTNADISASGMAGVELSILQLTGANAGQYFAANGAPPGFSNPVEATSWSTAAVHASSWTYATTALVAAFENGALYNIRVRAVDAAGNVQGGFAFPTSSRTFAWDNSAPSVAVTFPAEDSNWTPTSLTVLSGTAREEPTGVGQVNACFLQVNDDVDIELSYVVGASTVYWTNAGWSAPDVPGVVGRPIELAGSTTFWRLIPKPIDDGAAPVNSWQFAGERVFRLRARARDKGVDGTGALNRSVSGYFGDDGAGDYLTFVMDHTPPVSTMTWPLNGNFVNAISSITGTANAAVSGINKVEIKITTNNATGPWWNGSSYVFSETWSTTTVTGSSWEFPGTRLDNLSAAFSDHVRYYIYSKVTDNAGNVETSPTIFGFTYDSSGPDLAVSFPTPPSGSYYSNATGSTRRVDLTSGTVADSGANASGVSEVWVAISSGSGVNTMWWCDATATGPGCPVAGAFSKGPQAAIYWSTSVYKGGASWTYTHANLPAALSNGIQYKTYVRARDVAGTWTGNVPDNPEVSQLYFYDDVVPAVALEKPISAYHNRTLTVLSGTAQDVGVVSAGVNTVQVAVRQIGTGWWNFTSNTAFNVADPTTVDAWTNATLTNLGGGLFRWDVVFSTGRYTTGLNYQVVARPKDFATNVAQGAPAGGEGNTFKFDDVAPVVVSTFPVNNSFKNAVTMGALAGTASDAATGNTGLTSVRILLKARGSTNATWKGTYSNSSADWDTTAGKYNNWITVTGTAEWTQVLPSLAPVDNLKFSLWSLAYDGALNVSTSPSNAAIDADQNADGTPALFFTYDNTNALTATTFPLPNTGLQSVFPTISGTAADPGVEPSGVTEVRIRLKRSDDSYWNFFSDLAWDANSGDNFGVTGGAPTWTRNVPAGTLANGYRYDLYHFAIDNSLNNAAGGYFSTTTFIVDLSTPTAAITSPANNSFATAVTVLTGTSEDRYCKLVPDLCPGVGGRNYEAGIASTGTEISIQQLSDNMWWGGGSFNSATRVWSTATFTGASSGTWSYNLAGSGLGNNTTYYVVVRVRDLAGNLNHTYSTNYVTVDGTNPTSLAISPSGSQNNVTAITGTAQDTFPGELAAAGVVLLKIKKLAGAGDATVRYWDNGAVAWGPAAGPPIFFSTGIPTSVVGQPATWSYVTTQIPWYNDNDYQVTARAVDKAGNIKADPGEGTPDLTFTFTTPGAVTAITSPLGNLTNYRKGAITGVSGSGTNLRAVNSVGIHIQRLTTPTSWWSQDTQAWVDADTWTYTSCVGGNCAWGPRVINGAAAFTIDNTSYSIISEGYNTADATGPQGKNTIIIDNTAPIGAVNQPNRPFLNALPTLTGTATDPGRSQLPSTELAGIVAPGAQIYVRIKQISGVQNGQYWDGAAFNNLPASPGAADIVAPYAPGATVTWSTAPAAGPGMRDGASYRIIVIPQDKAGNNDFTGLDESQMGDFDFVYDTTTPRSTIGSVTPGQVYNTLASITGTAEDPAGSNPPGDKSDLEKVQIQIYDPVADTYWHTSGAGPYAGSFVGVSSFNTTSGAPASWSYANANLTVPGIGLECGKRYYVFTRAVDVAGNTQSGFVDNVSSMSFVW
ncbi:MAG: hypothetical protein AAB131_01230, partial [Actinomycetota bacterium]